MSVRKIATVDERVANPTSHKRQCERLGCPDTSVFLPVQCPHSGLQLLVCQDCYFARKMWDDLIREGKSKVYEGRFGG